MKKRVIKRFIWLFFIIIGINLQTKAGPFFTNEDVVSFCTDENALGISYPAGISEDEAFPFESGCLGMTPSPQWFIMQVEDPGLLGITIEHSEGFDIDFACYGPFEGKNKQEVINKINGNEYIYNVYDDYDFLATYMASDTCYPQEYLDELARISKMKDDIEIECENEHYLRDMDEFPTIADYFEYVEEEKELVEQCIEERVEQNHLITPPDPVQFDINNPCFRGYKDNYPLESMVDCSYSASSKEFCYIPEAKKGEWYLLLITNYSKKPGTIYFNKTTGEATTNCKIIVDAMTVGPICEGESFELDVNNAPENATFSWRGPNGFSSTIKNPTIHNATQENAGIYTVVMVHNGVASEEVEVPVTVHKRVTTSVTKVINEGETYMFGDDIISDAGEYQGTFASEITGCDSIVNLTLIVAKYDEVIATNDGPICEGDYLKLDAYNAPENASFHWTGPNGFSATGESIILENTPHDYAGTYTVVATVNGYDLPAAQTVVTINKKSHTVIDTTISEDETYLFNGNPISSPGTYEETFTNAAGCDSIVTLELKVKPTDPISITNNGPLCEGETLSLLSFSVIGAANNADYSWTGPNGFYSDKATPTIPNVSVENSGTYSLSVSKNGVLIATVETEVVINPTKFTEGYGTIMQGETFLFNGRSLSVAGTYVDTLSATTGCDSIVTLNLTISEYDPILIANNGPLCEGETLTFSVTNAPNNASFSWSGPNGFSSTETYPTLPNVSNANSGTYSLTVSVNGYDLPVAQTNVVVNPIQYTQIDTAILKGEIYLFNNQQISTAGTYQETLASLITGCDSIVTLNLSIRDFDPIIITNNGPLCEGETLTFSVTNAPNNASFSWSGPNGFSSTETYPTLPNVSIANSGTYSLTVSVNGYDLPVAQTNVVVNPIQYTQIDTTILQGEIYLFNGQSLSTTGTYQETLASLITGCDSIVTLNLSIKEYDPIIITNNGPLCEGETLIFDVTNAPDNATFSWSGPNGFSSSFQGLTISNVSTDDAGLYTLTVAVNGYELPSVQTDVVINEKRYEAINDSIKIGHTYQFNNKTLSEAGIYSDTLTSSIGCDSIVTLTLKLIVNDTLVITNNGPLCEGDNLALSVIYAPSNATFSWSGPNGFTSNNENPTLPDAKVEYNGLYSLVVTANGKTYNAETNVLVHPIKNDTISESILDDEYYQFGTDKLNIAGTYSKTFTSATGCDSTVTLILNVIEIKPAILSNNGPLCEGETLLLNMDEAPEGIAFEWKGPKGFTSTEQNPAIDNVTVSNAGTYTAKYVYRGKTYTLTTPVIVNKAKKQFVKAIIKGEETYTIGDTEYSEAGEYAVTLVSSAGCDSIVHLTLIRAYEPKDALIPDEVFTPNSDGVRDRWFIKNVELYSDLDVTIYDRTGKVVRVFKTYDNLENSWDGKDDKGRNLPSTDYWYVINVPESDKQYVGHVTLLR